MARLLRARARSLIMPRRIVKLSSVRPVSSADWHANPRPARGLPTVDWRAGLIAPRPFNLPGRQTASVGIMTRRVERERSRSQPPSCFAERHAWKR
jgi:hypothetical protein